MLAQDCYQLVVNQRWQNVVHGFVIIRLDDFGFGVGFNANTVRVTKQLDQWFFLEPN